MTAAPAQLEHLPIDGLIPYARNSRTHSPEQVAQIAASIREFGFTNPILIDADGGIIAGHGRVLAARQLGLATLPCLRLGHLNEAQKRAYIIADNKLALNAGWDEDLLAQEIKDLQAMDFGLDLLGFDASDLDKYLAETGGEMFPEKKDGITYQEKYAVLVECQSEKDQERIYNQLTGLGLTCKVLVN